MIDLGSFLLGGIVFGSNNQRPRMIRGGAGYTPRNVDQRLRNNLPNIPGICWPLSSKKQSDAN